MPRNLKECPLCGKEAHLCVGEPVGAPGFSRKSHTTITCSDCGLHLYASTPTMEGSYKKAEKLWNRRAS